MTKQEVLQKIVDAAMDAINGSEEFSAACDEMPAVGLQRFVLLNIDVFEQPAQPALPLSQSSQASDADFLRMLRIAPDLEAR